MRGEVCKVDLHNHEIVRVTRFVLRFDSLFHFVLTCCEAAGQGQVAVLGCREHMGLPGFATFVNVLLRVSRLRGPRTQRALYPFLGMFKSPPTMPLLETFLKK